MIYFVILILLFMGACDQTDDTDDIIDNSSIIVSLQDSDKVAIVSASNLQIKDQVSIDLNTTDCSEFTNNMDCIDAGCMWMENHNHCMAMGGAINAPHDIAVDNLNGYWFTTAMSGGYVNMYSNETNQLLSSFDIGHMPALMALDKGNQIIYISRGMPNGSSMPIYELSYETGILLEVEQWDVQFDYAHGIHFDEVHGNVYVVSKTNDYIAKINPNAAQEPFINPQIVSMDESINNNFTIQVNRLWPIEISAKYPYMFITCSAGDWLQNQESYNEIAGQVQMWHMETMELLDTYEFDTYSRPWHIEVSSVEDKFFVSLSGGDEDSGSDSGVACIEYSAIDGQYSMSESWITKSSEYGTLHGITFHADCDGNYYVYSAGRTDGNIYKFDPNTGEELGYSNLVSSGSVRTGGIDSFVAPCDASCECD